MEVWKDTKNLNQLGESEAAWNQIFALASIKATIA